MLVADSVGLGKSFIAAELFTEVIERNRQRALLIAPAQLRDGMWEQFRRQYQVGIEVVSFEQLAGDGQLGQGHGAALSARLDEYSLIVIDEAHAFRNPDTMRARALRQLLRGDPPRKVVLLTATPVNNSLWDLYDLLTYFVGHDAVFADRGIPSLRKRFQQADKANPFSLSPDTLFDILDETTVRRTRQFVQRFYPNDHFRLQDGTEVTIRFPDPVVHSLSYDLDEVLPGFFDEFAEVLDPEDGDPQLTMARYWPTRYRRNGAPEARETALVGLIRSGLLKRFESSSRAFVQTVSRMVDAHDHFVLAVEAGVILSSDSLAALCDPDSDESWEELLREGEPVEDDLDTERLIEDVRSDRALLKRLGDRAAKIRAENDPKLKLLVKELVRIAAEAEREGISEPDIRNRRKVLVFSYFIDTVEWIAERLRTVVDQDRRLARYRGRIAVVGGTDSRDGVTRSDAVFGFAPESTEAPPAKADDTYDILVTTDVLAEGMNLQQCGRIINYDLPWNPMRLVQRHGRIDRIGSPHEKVFLTCVFPIANSKPSSPSNSGSAGSWPRRRPRSDSIRWSFRAWPLPSRSSRTTASRSRPSERAIPPSSSAAARACTRTAVRSTARSSGRESSGGAMRSGILPGAWAPGSSAQPGQGTSSAPAPSTACSCGSCPWGRTRTSSATP